MQYFTTQEFQSKICTQHQVQIIDSADLMSRYNEDAYHPMDGLLIKANDNLAAFMEAYLSLQTGIRSHALSDGYRKLYKMGMQKTYPGIS